MPDETPDQPGPPLAMPEDSLKSWNADESELLSSLNRVPDETTPRSGSRAGNRRRVPLRSSDGPGRWTIP